MKFINIPETQRRLGIGRSTVYRLFGEGVLHPVHIGRRTMVVEAEVEGLQVGLAAEAGVDIGSLDGPGTSSEAA